MATATGRCVLQVMEGKKKDDQFQLAQHSVHFRLASQTGKVGSIAFSIRAKLANKSRIVQSQPRSLTCLTFASVVVLLQPESQTLFRVCSLRSFDCEFLTIFGHSLAYLIP